MSEPTNVILYVENLAASRAFYSELLAKEPADASPNFAIYVLASGVMLGLWARHDVRPESKAGGGGAELGIVAKDEAEVDAKHGEWKGRGWIIAQKPVRMDFGYTFTALDPDGHRVRVLKLA